jgi:transcriptional regulator with XRE-family HTH domain
MTAPRPRRERLAKELARARDLAGLSGRGLARRLKETKPDLKVSQGTVWRIEDGQVLPAMPVVRAWLELCEIDEPNQERIVELAEAAHGETRSWKELVQEERHLQGVARERELAAVRVRNFQPTVVPGLLQTPEYAGSLIPLADVTASTEHEAAVAKRLARQQVLYEEGRQFQFVMTEHVLRWAPGPRGILTAQLDRIASLAGLDTVDVAVVPVDAPVLVPWHNFVIWEPADGAPFVTTELVHGEQELHDPEQVALYEKLWDRMWSSAAVGDQARTMVREALS